MDKDRTDRMKHLHQSNSAKIAWKKHRANYMRANRKKSRDNMNKTFFGIAKELEPYINEAEQQKDDIFDLKYETSFENISGGLSFSINKETGDISFTTLLNEEGHGNYKSENESTEDSLKSLYNDLKDEFTMLANNIDTSVRQILAKHGLRET